MEQKISNMRCLIQHVERAVQFANLFHLVKRKWEVRDMLNLYSAVKHLFEFSILISGKQQRYEQLDWKMYYNILTKRKGMLFGEQLEST